MKALDQPRGHDPDHALVPVLAREHVPAASSLALGKRVDERCGLAQDSVLDRLPVAVQPSSSPARRLASSSSSVSMSSSAMSGRQRRPAALILGARAESDRPRVDGGVHTRAPHERLERPAACRRAQPGRRERTVLVHERDDVGDRRERDEVEVALESPDRRREGLVELAHDAGAAELGKRVRRRPGRNDRTVRQRFARAMVVGDDDLEAQALRLRHLDRGDAAADGEHESVPSSASFARVSLETP